MTTARRLVAELQQPFLELDRIQQEHSKRLHNIFGTVAGAALPHAAAPVAPALPAEADCAKSGDHLSGDALARMLTAKEQVIRQAASEAAYHQGRGGQAIAEAEDAAQEFRSLSPTAVINRLIADHHLDAIAAKDENLRKRVEYVMRTKLRWAKPKRRSRQRSSPGATAELGGKGIIGRPLSLTRNTAAVEWCFNHGVTIAVPGEQFCHACMERLSHDEREAMLAGDIPRECNRLSPEALRLHRQQALELQREESLTPRRFAR